MKIGKIKQIHQKCSPMWYHKWRKQSDIRLEITSTHNYNTRLSTKRVNHVTFFKNAPKMFKMDATEKIKLRIGTDYFACIDAKKETITVTPMENHLNWKITRKILRYRYPVNMDAPVWTNSMCNELDRLYQVWKRHAGNDIVEFIFHKDKPKDRKATYVRALWDIRTQKNRLTEQEFLQDEILYIIQEKSAHQHQK